jgi:hypothetical protein
MWVTDLGGVKLVATWTVLMLKKNLNSPPDYLCILESKKRCLIVFVTIAITTLLTALPVFSFED